MKYLFIKDVIGCTKASKLKIPLSWVARLVNNTATGIMIIAEIQEARRELMVLSSAKFLPNELEKKYTT